MKSWAITCFLLAALVLLPGGAAHAQATYRVENCAALATLYPWRDIASSGTGVALPLDSTSAAISLGFNFSFGGSSYSQLRISSSGRLFFSGVNVAYINTILPAAGVDTLLLPYWDDLNPNNNASRIRYQTLGSAPNRVFVVSWLAIPHYCTGGSGCASNQTTALTETFQVQLHESSNEIVFSYRSMSTFGGGWTSGPNTMDGAGRENGATIGIEVNNSDFVQHSFNTNSIANGTTLLFSRLTAPSRCVNFNHLRIEHSGSGVTCTPTTLTVRACADAACATPFAGGVSGTLTASGGPTANWVGGAGFSILAGSSSTTKQVQVTTAGSVTWGATGLAPAPTGSPATRCFVGATESCSFTSALAGFLFDVPHHAADTPQTVAVSAVRQADNSLACTPAFTGTRTVNFSCAYTNPNSGTLPVVVGGGNIACGGAGSGIPLTFNASGVATTTARYADVGQMSLTATFTGSGTEAGLVMTGSDTFIAAPASFLVTPAGPYVAGSNFSVAVAARNASGNLTPNFGKESTTENVTLGHTLVGPAGGNDPALTGTPTLADAAFQAGNGQASTTVAWGEVGDISLTATLSSGSYLGSGLTASGSAAAGPFRPHHFITVVTPGTGSFSYSGQPFSVEVTAKNAAGGTTLNYVGAYAKAVSLTDGNGTANNSATLGTFGNAAIAAASFGGGVATAGNVSYRFNAKTTAPLEAPASAPLKLRATDSDGVTSASGPAGAEGVTPIRSGRLVLANAHGSEFLPLGMPFQTQYWTGGAWATNTLDSATAIAATLVFVKNPAGMPAPAVGAFAAGKGTLNFPAPGQKGTVEVCANLGSDGDHAIAGCQTGTLLPWLQGSWDADGQFNDNPAARATFGIFQGRAPVIYRRERY